MVITPKRFGRVYFRMERRWWPSKAAPSCQGGGGERACVQACLGSLQEQKVKRPPACIIGSNNGWNPLTRSPSFDLPRPPLWCFSFFSIPLPHSLSLRQRGFNKESSAQRSNVPSAPRPGSRSAVAPLMLPFYTIKKHLVLVLTARPKLAESQQTPLNFPPATVVRRQFHPVPIDIVKCAALSFVSCTRSNITSPSTLTSRHSAVSDAKQTARRADSVSTGTL